VSKSANGLLTNGPKSVLTEETWLEDGTYVFAAGTNGCAAVLGRVKAGFSEYLGLLTITNISLSG